MDGSPSPDQFWAKLKYNDDDRSTGEIVEWHPLLAHSADVAAVTEALLQRTILRSRLASLAGWDDLDPVHIARLSALAALHDAGKACHGFQNRGHGERPTCDHLTPIVGLFEATAPLDYLEPLGVLEMAEWVPPRRGDEVLSHFLLATFGHHGAPVPPSRHEPMYWEATENRDPLAKFKDLASHTRAWFPAAFNGDAPSFPADPALQHAFNGLLTLADWIGSDEDFFPFADALDDPMDRARAHAEDAVDALFLDASTSRAALGADAGFDQVLEHPDWDPYPIQEAVRDVPLHETGGLAVLESDTGSGKTEAALTRFVRLYREGLVDGMYFAVPTRTAATQLHGRVTEAVKRLFLEGTRPPVVQAVPGYIKADDVTATRLPDSVAVRWDEQVQHRGWAAESSKRYLAAPIAVGTVDQVLLSTLQASHAHMRAAALLRHFLVVDEVHASDAYMTRLMDRVLDQHLAAGGHALLMSATLGASARVHLTTENGEVPSREEAEAEDYPLVTHVDADRTHPASVHAASSDASKTVEPALCAEANAPEAVARRALKHARSGARVLVIRNLVDDCIATQRALEDLADDSDLLFGVDGTPAPHHSRFAPDDRQRLDDAVEDTFGPDTSNRGIVAVATQTVEQSLDLDADLMITDLCPMDVLLQRIGRLHRHSRDRPDGYDTARCVVLTPETRDLASAITGDGQGFQGEHGLGTVYGDLRTIAAAWDVLADDALAPWHIPDDNRLLVERGTHPDRLHRVVETADDRDAWRRHEQWVLGARQADRQATGHVTIDRTQPFGAEPFPDDLDTAKTRLGQEDYRVELPAPVEGPFRDAISELSVSEWQLDEPPETEEATDVSAEDGGFTFRFSGRSFRYDRFGLESMSS
ncbi:MAG: CRISPR-associated helicase Cas3' [Salinivenus sp.]